MDDLMKRKFLQAFRICAAILCILFFTLPLVQCSMDSSLTATGFEIASGTGDLYNEWEEGGDPLVFILIAVPVILLILAFAKKSSGILRNASIVGLVAKIVFIIAANARLNSEDYEGLFELTDFNYFVVAIYIGLICIAQFGIKKEEAEIT